MRLSAEDSRFLLKLFKDERNRIMDMDEPTLEDLDRYHFCSDFAQQIETARNPEINLEVMEDEP